MTQALATVARAGLATVQDGGRPGYADVGVPASGALHRQRYLAATAVIVGAPDPDCPAVELLQGGIELRTHVPVVAGLVGAAAWHVGGRRAAAGTSVLIPAGAQVDVAHRGEGPAYLVLAGWQAPRTLGSASTDTFSGLGGTVLRPGLVLRGDPRAAATAEVGVFHRPLPEPSGAVRVLEAGSGALLAGLAASAWHVEEVARSGIRLVGGTIRGSGQAASLPLLPGAIQVTPGGQAIILGPDGGVTGGYPVAGVVATVDLDRLSLLSRGAEVRFRVVTVEDAARAHADRSRRLGHRPTRPHLIG